MRKFRQISECYLFLIEEKTEFITKINFSDLAHKNVSRKRILHFSLGESGDLSNASNF